MLPLKNFVLLAPAKVKVLAVALVLVTMELVTVEPASVSIEPNV